MAILPDCMMPDGADSCAGYHQLYERLAALEKLRSALALIAAFKGKTLIAPCLGEYADCAHQLGAMKAFNQAAEIAESALSNEQLL